MENILTWLKEEATLVIALLAALGICIDITPWVKINPVRFLLKSLGNALTVTLNSNIETIKNDVRDLREDVDNNEIFRLRYEILDFADSLKNGRRATRDQFKHILEASEKYHSILDKRKLTNGLIDMEMEYIKAIYKELTNNNNFL